MISLRPATEEDDAFMRALYGHYRAEEKKHFPFDANQWERFLDQQFEAQSVYYRDHYPGSERSIIEEDHQPVGRLFIDRREREIRIMDIALVPAAQNRGIGTRLVREILVEGEETGKPVTIHVEAYNPALRLYERLGFRRVDTNGVYFLMKWGN